MFHLQLLLISHIYDQSWKKNSLWCFGLFTFVNLYQEELKKQFDIDHEITKYPRVECDVVEQMGKYEKTEEKDQEELEDSEKKESRKAKWYKEK